MRMKKIVSQLHSASEGSSHVDTPKATATQIVAPLNARQHRRIHLKINQLPGRKWKTGELGKGRFGW